MKRFLLVIGETYYPAGGLSDYHRFFDAVEEARAFLTEGLNVHRNADGWAIGLGHPLAQIRPEGYWSRVDWAQIWDLVEDREVAHWESHNDRSPNGGNWFLAEYPIGADGEYDGTESIGEIRP